MPRVQRLATCAVSLVVACGSEPLDPVDPREALVHKGSLSLFTTADLEAATAFERVEGDVIVLDGASFVALRLPRLREVTGSVRVARTAATGQPLQVDLPALTNLGLNLELIQVGEPTSVFAPVLEFVGGHVDLALGAYGVELLALRNINGDVRVRDARLDKMEAPALERIGGAFSLLRYSGMSMGAARVDLELKSLQEIAGNLSIRQGVETRITFPALRNVERDVSLSDARLQLRAEQLASIGGELRVSSASLIGLEWPNLATVRGDLVFEGNTVEGASIPFPLLATVGQGILWSETQASRLEFPVLAQLGRALLVRRCASLDVFTAPMLTQTTGNIVFADNGRLSVSLSGLTTAGADFEFNQNATLSLNAPALRSVVGAFLIATTVISELNVAAIEQIGRNLTWVDLDLNRAELVLPSLRSTGRNLELGSVRGLGRFALPALTTVGSMLEGGSLIVRDNTVLSSFEATAVERVFTDVRVERNALLDEAAVLTQVGGAQIDGATTACGNRAPSPACPD